MSVQGLIVYCTITSFVFSVTIYFLGCLPSIMAAFMKCR
jgi:hypothetical protein